MESGSRYSGTTNSANSTPPRTNCVVSFPSFCTPVRLQLEAIPSRLDSWSRLLVSPALSRTQLKSKGEAKSRFRVDNPNTISRETIA